MSICAAVVCLVCANSARAQAAPAAPAPAPTPSAAEPVTTSTPEVAPTPAPSGSDSASGSVAPPPAEPSPPATTNAPAKVAATPEIEPHKKKQHKARQHEAADEAADSDTPKDSFPGDPFGEDGAGLRSGMLSLRVLLQTRYRQTYAKSSKNPRGGYALREDVLVHDGDGFDLQRFFLRIAADPIEELGFKAILDFAKLNNPENVVKQAYATVRPVPKHVEIAAGILKLPYSTMELDPIARFELTDLGSTDDLIKELGFGGRDVGAELMVAPLPTQRLLRISLGAFGGHAKDEHASPLGAVGARIETKPLKGLRLGIDAVGMPNSQDYKRPFETSNKDLLPLPPDPLYPREQRWAAGKAYSADLSFERYHFTLRSEGLLGDRVDVDERYGARSFWAVWALAAYDVHAGWLRLTPAVRVEWLDLDRDHDLGARREIAGGIGVPFKKRMRLLLDVKRTDVQKGTPVINSPKPLPAVPYFDLSSTRVTAQFQVEL